MNRSDFSGERLIIAAGILILGIITIWLVWPKKDRIVREGDKPAAMKERTLPETQPLGREKVGSVPKHITQASKSPSGIFGSDEIRVNRIKEGDEISRLLEEWAERQGSNSLASSHGSGISGQGPDVEPPSHGSKTEEYDYSDYDAEFDGHEFRFGGTRHFVWTLDMLDIPIEIPSHGSVVDLPPPPHPDTVRLNEIGFILRRNPNHPDREKLQREAQMISERYRRYVQGGSTFVVHDVGKTLPDGTTITYKRAPNGQVVRIVEKPDGTTRIYPVVSRARGGWR